jgi:sugar lactone lactonase YvrE
VALGGPVAAAPLVMTEDPRLQVAYQSDRVWNGVATTPGGRVFVVYTQADKSGVQLEEISATGARSAFPDAAWNIPAKHGDVGHAFVQVNSIRIGPDGDLWIIDAGAPAAGKKAVAGGARLFKINLQRNQVEKIFSLSHVVKPNSFIDDFRFHDHYAYLSDAGEPGLIVLDLKTGSARRVLDNVPVTTDARPLYADGKRLVDEKGKLVLVHADQLEVSPDGKILYFEPASGPLSKIATRLLEDETLGDHALLAHVEKFADTPSTGGTVIDAQGNVYDADENRRCILKITPAGAVSTFLCDRRLIWADAMWIDHDEMLWIPVSQMSLTPGMNGGKNAVRYPVTILKMKLGIGPSPIDHD